MGKALLIMVMGTGLYVAISQYGTQQNLIQTAEQQAGYEQEVLAREIARSGFNVGMGIARPYGANLVDAAQAINGQDGVMTGEHQGGEYRVTARLLEGFTIEITSTGYFGGHWDRGEYKGGAQHTMTDTYTIPVLMARQCSALRVKFLQSQAGYCSAIFLQQYPLGVTAEPAPEMLFAASHNADYDTLTVEKYIASGTQMNFFIGVDQDCSTRPGGRNGPASGVRSYDVLNHVYNEHDYDYRHYALDLRVDRLDDMSESIWALVEQHPSDNQRWRIGWEDIHDERWDNPNSTDPRNSLQALKIYGYDGDGWPTRDAYGYRTLEDGNLDLSDQVVEVRLDAVDPSTTGGACEVNASIPPSEPIPGGGEEPPGEEPPGDDGGTTPDDPGGSGSTDDPDDDGSGGWGDSDDDDRDHDGDDDPNDDGSGGCWCSGNKVGIMHYPPGNPRNAHPICISWNAWGGKNGHSRHSRDYVICGGH